MNKKSFVQGLFCNKTTAFREKYSINTTEMFCFFTLVYMFLGLLDSFTLRKGTKNLTNEDQEQQQ
jgi:hypothetical protein